MADCRMCVYFVRYDDLDGEMKYKARNEAMMRGEPPLGWCMFFDRVVTYYVGKCRGYRPKEITSQSLTKWIKIIR